MIKKVEMFTVICDNCKVDIGINQDYSCWGDKLYAEDNAMNSDWLKIDEKHYCEDCYSYDNEDNLIINESRKEQKCLK